MTRKQKAQAARFARLFAAALLTQAVALDLNHLTRSVAISAVIAALEVAFRQVRPADAGTAGESA